MSSAKYRPFCLGLNVLNFHSVEASEFLYTGSHASDKRL